VTWNCDFSAWGEWTSKPCRRREEPRGRTWLDFGDVASNAQRVSRSHQYTW